MIGPGWTGSDVRVLAPPYLDTAADRPVAVAVLSDRGWFADACADESVLVRLRRLVHPRGVLLVPSAHEDSHHHLLARHGFDEVHNVRPATRIWLEHAAGQLREPATWLAARQRRSSAPARDPLSAGSDTPPRHQGTNNAAHRVAYIVCVRDEAPRLPALLDSLDGTAEFSRFKRQFVFVINGCSDNSERLLEAYAAQRDGVFVTRSAPGITQAFVTGIRQCSGASLIGKIDADVTFEPDLLDRLEQTFVGSQPPRVAYADPVCLDPPVVHARGEQDPNALTSRSYYVAKACLLVADDLRDPATQRLMLSVCSDDIVLSAVLVWRHGLDAIRRASEARVRFSTLRTFEDLVRQLSRVESALRRLVECAPHLAPLLDVFDQRVEDVEYARVLEHAATCTAYTEEWLRLDSAKTGPRL